ncbi:response regulator [Litorihabitans aurantiacus]|uniref:DNA-binding response regulator n=1 Tax=Litorihabitans aurantiacus TaxID=1930061 RepID=A0AA37XFT1_9MICO|nr:response regulator transcription factor [Litorihabitans aurantiacus]GMA32653.1 DNA-binding response regulator [Litorihabitans aurantiacus]
MSAPIRVLLVDDDPLVRAGLRLMLEVAPDVAIVGEASDGAEVVDLVGALAPDVVLMDIRMPRVDGVAATAELARLGPRAPGVLVLTTFGADATVVAALRAGAAGYLLKDTPPAQIVEAVRRVADGEPAFSPDVTRALVALATAGGGGAGAGIAETPSPTASEAVAGRDPRGVAREAARVRIAALTPREHEVADAVAQGLSNAEIAASLYLSTSSVKVHLSSALAKLGMVNRVQLAILAHEARGPG